MRHIAQQRNSSKPGESSYSDTAMPITPYG
jgi:transposase-like protein